MLTNNISKAIFQGNGVATEFPFSFKVWEPSQLIVSIIDSHNSETIVTDWSLTLSDHGGTITYLHEGQALAKGYTLVILRHMPFTQNVDLVTGTRFDPQVIEDALDKATAERQQLFEAMGRSIKIGPASSFTADDLLSEIFSARAESFASATSANKSANDATKHAANAKEHANHAKTEADRAASTTSIPDDVTITKNENNEFSVLTTSISDIPALSLTPTADQIAARVELENRPSRAGDVLANKLAALSAQEMADEAHTKSGFYVPNWDAPISAPVTTGSTYTAPSDGFIHIYAARDPSYYIIIKINENSFYASYGSAVIIPVRKSTISHVIESSVAGRVHRFYPAIKS